MVNSRRSSSYAPSSTSRRWSGCRLLAVGTVLLFSVGLIQPCQAALSCFTDSECTAKLRKGSYCIDGSCSNPFAKGCLATLLETSSENEYKLGGRVCNSDDIKAGSNDCTDYSQEFDYPEIRVHNSNWESSIFNAWIYQILLMEIVNVPVTVGLTSDNTAAASFYSPSNTLEYSSVAYPWDALQGAEKCEDTLEECVHVFPEVWIGQESTWTDAVNNELIEPVEGNGQVGKISWYVPQFTVQKDPSLISFYGLAGEENRHKLAEEFKRPTTWQEYCDQVSEDACATPDDVAQAYPGEADFDKYWSPPGYTGHFRIMPEDNCTNFPDTCQGNFIAPPCSWSSNVDSQLFWNDIKMRPTGPLDPYGGYGYSAMIQVWRAAVHTKSSIIMWWWRPEALTEEFYGTDGQFQQVLLPETTHACSRNRISPTDRCSADIEERRGHPLGSCDQEAHALRKLISFNLKESSEAEPIASRSPGYEMIKSIKVSDLEMDTMLTDWILKSVDPYGNDAREAVCGWVVDNLDELMRFVPQGYPKELSMNSPYDTGLMTVALSLAVFVGFVVLVTAGFAYRFRDRRVFIYAQAHIVSLILVGFLLIIVGAILITQSPSDGLCVAKSWFINLGYTIELVPLLVKISAINKILTSAKKMKRVKITREGMLMNVAFVLIPLIIYLVVWTIIDPPRQVEERVLSDESSTTVETSLSCQSDLGFWSIVAFCWQALLLLAATVLAFQSRHIEQEFNESRSLGTMIYSHFLFMILRGVTYSLGQQEILLPNAVAGVTSFLLSLDTLFAICIYLLPKCVEAKTGSSVAGSSADAATASRANMNSSPVMSQIQANGKQKSISRLSSGNSSDKSKGSGAAGNAYFNRRSRHSVSRYSSNMEEIAEGSHESSSRCSRLSHSSGSERSLKSKDHLSGSDRSGRSKDSLQNLSRASSGSIGFRMDATGNIIPSIGGEDLPQEQAPVSRTTKSTQSTRTSSFCSVSSLTPSQIEKFKDPNDDDYESSSDDEAHDAGGPRFTSAAQNEKLRKSVQGQEGKRGSSTHSKSSLELEALHEEEGEGDEVEQNSGLV